MLVDSGADLNAADSDGDTPLHLAATIQNVEDLKLLLKHSGGMKINAANNMRMTPLHLALLVDNEEAERKADVNAADDNGDTPVHVAVFTNHTDLLRQLLASRPNVEARHYTGATPLFVITETGKIQEASMLLDWDDRIDNMRWSHVSGIVGIDVGVARMS